MTHASSTAEYLLKGGALNDQIGIFLVFVVQLKIVGKKHIMKYIDVKQDS